MSAHPNIQTPADASRLPMTLPRLFEKKRLGEPIVMVTAYDFPSARAAEEAGVDLVLVGDSGAMTVLGYPSTVGVELDELLVLARATRRGLRTPFLVGDLPFGSYEVSDEQAVQTAFRFVKEAGCDAVKLEGGGPVSVARARAIVQAGIPVMGHVGLTPQTSTALGGYRAQGRTAAAAARIAARGARAAGGRAASASCSRRSRRRSPPSSCRASRSRSSASAPARPPTARCSSSTTSWASARASARASSSATRRCRTRWSRASRRTPTTCARALPGARARLLDRRVGARGVPGGAGGAVAQDRCEAVGDGLRVVAQLAPGEADDSVAGGESGRRPWRGRLRTPGGCGGCPSRRSPRPGGASGSSSRPRDLGGRGHRGRR